MPRPCKPRRVRACWRGGLISPQHDPGCHRETVLLQLDELEALRLADAEGFSHEQAAIHMEISRPTFSRLIERARRKVATALLGGAAMELEGQQQPPPRGRGCGRGRRYCPQCHGSANRCRHGCGHTQEEQQR
ncbi:MAG: hypothetical protein BIFFINMI_01017 [Phycisphaerae bacterium]|nr:hypothetical protein [Phycisphaerae bacterium]